MRLGVLPSYYQERLEYIIKDLKIPVFDIGAFTEELLSALLIEDKSNQLKYSGKEKQLILREIEIEIEFLYLDLTLIDDAFSQGIIKSHEIREITHRLTDKIKNATIDKFNNLQYIVNKIPRYKNRVKLDYMENIIDDFRRSDKISINFIKLEKRIKNKLRITPKDVILFIKLWNSEEINFCEKIKISVFGKSFDNNDLIIILEKELNKVKLSEIQDYLNINDKETLVEFYSNPIIKKILFSYFFPEGFDSNAEITYDKLEHEKPAQKRRRILTKQGELLNLHNFLFKNISSEEFRQIIEMNDIGAFYCSVRSTKNEVLYMIIDIDVSDFLFSLFTGQLIWDFILNITNAIIETSIKVGFPPYPVVNFSGSRGIHIIWRIDENAINDLEGSIDLPEFFNDSLPGVKNLIKNKNSCYHDKFIFIKRFAQALCIETIYRGSIIIPKEIRQNLSILHPRDLFKISIYSQNEIAVLLDTSSNAKGVFRAFSAHLNSKKIGIPIFYTRIGKIYEEYRDYYILLKESQINNVLDNIKDNNYEKYMQYPAIIKKDHLRFILRTDNLFPSFAILLRFSPRYVFERTPKSFEFWHRYYTLKHFYSYTANKVLFFPIEKDDKPQKIYEEIIDLSKKCNISNIQYISEIIREHLINNKITFNIFEERLFSMHSFEFYFKLMPDFLKSPKGIEDLLEDQHTINFFSNQAQKLISTTLQTLSLIISKSSDKSINREKLTVLISFQRELNGLINFTESKFLDNYGDDKTYHVNKLYLIYKFYLCMIDFLKRMFKKEQESEV